MSATQILAAFGRAVDEVGRVVDSVPAERWGAESPCAGWTALDTLSHLVGTMRLIALPFLVDGAASPFPCPPDRFPLTPATASSAWRGVAAELHAALATADPEATVMLGDVEVPLGKALRFPVGDLVVHAWDIAVSTGVPAALDPELVAVVDASVRRTAPEILRMPEVFGPEVIPPEGADDTERLVAFLGRDPGTWRQS